MTHILLRTGIVLGATLLVPVGAVAQTTISHSKALAGSITPGDAPGYPVTISRPGSFRLTSNLSVLDTDGIRVTASNVTIDLNGFSIRGISTVGDGGAGVESVERASTVTVRNGHVSSMSRGVHLLGTFNRVEGVSVTNNHSDSGITVGAFSTITGSLVAGNGLGIVAGDGTFIADNAVTANDGFGIRTGDGGSVIRNTVRSNAGLGLMLGARTGYADNVLTGNSGGGGELQVTGGIQMGRNVCGTNTVCP